MGSQADAQTLVRFALTLSGDRRRSSCSSSSHSPLCLSRALPSLTLALPCLPACQALVSSTASS